MALNLKANVNQTVPEVLTDNHQGELAASKLGELFTADWKQRLIRAGLAWEVHVGGITASANILPVVGGGNGTTIDTDQPELCVGIGAGYKMIVMEANCAGYNDPVTDNAITNIVLFADRSQAPTTATLAASATIATPLNLLDGAATTFPGRAYVAATGDIAATPVCSELLDYSCNQLGCTTGGSSICQIKLDYQPEAPSVLQGPCQVFLCFGGTAATSGMGVVKVAVIPDNYVPVA